MLIIIPPDLLTQGNFRNGSWYAKLKGWLERQAKEEA